MDAESAVFGAIAGAVVSWIFGYFNRRDDAALRIHVDQTVKTHEATLRLDVERQLVGAKSDVDLRLTGARGEVDRAVKTHEAELRLLVDQEVQKARGEVERDLKSHEIRLRVEADLRLRFIDRMLNDVGQYRAKLVAAYNSIYLLTQEAEPHGQTSRFAGLVDEAKRAFAGVPGTGPFVPPEVLDDTILLFDEAHSCFRNVVQWSQLESREERTPRCHETNAAIEDIAARTRQVFGSWQNEQFAVLRAGVAETSIAMQ